MLVPCLTSPCYRLIDTLVELDAASLLSVATAAAGVWLLLLRYVSVRCWLVSSLAAASGALVVGHHWRAPQCMADAANGMPSPAEHAAEMRLHVFWHIGAFETRAARLDEIVGRQWALLNSSGLLDSARIHLGLVGSARPRALRRVLRHPHVRVAARNATGHECITSSALWRWAIAESCHRGWGTRWWPLTAGATPTRFVLYMHSRGLRHDASCYANASRHARGPCAEDWTRAMEHFTIERWRDALAAMERSGALTAGLELSAHPARNSRRRGGFAPVQHYAGNFWWARPTWLARLPDPLSVSRHGRDRHECCEDWLLTQWHQWQRHEVLHYTGVRPGLPGRIHKYKDRYPEDMWRCADAEQPVRPSRTPCRPILTCHGSFGCPNVPRALWSPSGTKFYRR